VSWFTRNISAAKKEFINLKHVYRKGVSVPRPIFRVLHVILMEKLDGWLLSDIKKLNEPRKIYRMIIYEVKKTYDAGVVNGDLSQFNVFLSRDGGIYLIDWPQAVTTDNPKSIHYLKSDLINITRYFMKKYNLAKTFILQTMRMYDFDKVIDINEVLKSS
jgi:RIO-like serine/threonine protein kinase